MNHKLIVSEYPYNLLLKVRGRNILELPAILTKDVQAGIAYALSTLEEIEQDVLDKKYRLYISLNSDQQQIEKRALSKLRSSSRWTYMYYGIAGCLKKKVDEAKKKGFAQGYQVGYMDGIKAHENSSAEQETVSVINYPIESMVLSTRVCNALRESGCRTVRDVASLSIQKIRMIRNLGKIGVHEVLSVLHSYGLIHTEWELY